MWAGTGQVGSRCWQEAHLRGSKGSMCSWATLGCKYDLLMLYVEQLQAEGTCILPVAGIVAALSRAAQQKVCVFLSIA